MSRELGPGWARPALAVASLGQALGAGAAIERVARVETGSAGHKRLEPRPFYTRSP
jgi:hypothetical protein